MLSVVVTAGVAVVAVADTVVVTAVVVVGLCVGDIPAGLGAIVGFGGSLGFSGLPGVGVLAVDASSLTVDDAIVVVGGAATGGGGGAKVTLAGIGLGFATISLMSPVEFLRMEAAVS